MRMSFEEWEAKSEPSPERALIFAIIQQAIQDAFSKDEKLRTKARNWLTIPHFRYDDVRRFLYILDIEQTSFIRKMKELFKKNKTVHQKVLIKR